MRGVEKLVPPPRKSGGPGGIRTLDPTISEESVISRVLFGVGLRHSQAELRALLASSVLHFCFKDLFIEKSGVRVGSELVSSKFGL